MRLLSYLWLALIALVAATLETAAVLHAPLNPGVFEHSSRLIRTQSLAGTFLACSAPVSILAGTVLLFRTPRRDALGFFLAAFVATLAVALHFLFNPRFIDLLHLR